MTRRCICRHKEVAHDKFGECRICECRCFRPRKRYQTKRVPRFPRRHVKRRAIK